MILNVVPGSNFVDDEVVPDLQSHEFFVLLFSPLLRTVTRFSVNLTREDPRGRCAEGRSKGTSLHAKIKNILFLTIRAKVSLLLCRNGQKRDPDFGGQNFRSAHRKHELFLGHILDRA